jgi:hypothetical protein
LEEIISDINILMAIKDFEITFKKIQTSSSKKDVGFVTEFNAISQYIENISKTQKGELPADKELGSDYFTYIFDGQIYKSEIEVKLAADILSKIYYLLKTKVTLINFTDSLIEFKVDYTTTNKVGNQNDSTCYIEVEI